MASAFMFFFVAGSILLTGVQTVEGRTIIENNTVENITTVEEVYQYEDIGGIQLNSMAVVFALIGLFLVLGVATAAWGK